MKLKFVNYTYKSMNKAIYHWHICNNKKSKNKIKFKKEEKRPPLLRRSSLSTNYGLPR